MMKRPKQLPTQRVDNERSEGRTAYEHPAFATLQVTEVSGGSRVLFGSDVDHQYRLRLQITPAYLVRDLSHDWFHASVKTMVEFEMTHAQFAALAGSVGKGGGVPITLMYKPKSDGCEMVPAIDRIESKIDLFSREVAEKARRSMESMQAQINRLGAALESGKVGTKELREIHRNLNAASENLPGNLKYTVGQAQEMLEQASNDARTQVEAYVDSVARRTGLERIVQMSGGGEVALPQSNERSTGGES